jgi:hypothetical protein
MKVIFKDSSQGLKENNEWKYLPKIPPHQIIRIFSVHRIHNNEIRQSKKRSDTINNCSRK